MTEAPLSISNLKLPGHAELPEAFPMFSGAGAGLDAALTQPCSESGEMGIPRITLRQLVYFSTAARHGSALHAAEELSISPPAISSAIAGLESLLGEPLFVRRHARGLVLTEAGHHLLQESREIISHVREIEARWSSRHRKQRPQITLGCLGDIAPNVIPPLVRSFQASHPETDIRWQADGHPQLMNKLEDGSVDLIFVLDFEISPTLQSTVLKSTPVKCVLPSSYRNNEEDVDLSRLAHKPFILLDIPKTRDYFLSVFGDLGVQPSIAHRAASAEMVRGLVANGFGYSLLNFGSEGREDIAYHPVRSYTDNTHLVAVRQYKHQMSPLIDGFIASAQASIQAHDITPRH